MPSLDPIRVSESEEDCALREELRQLLGAPSGEFFEVGATPEMIALAEDLRHEAARRRRTARHRPVRMLLAAGLPLALVFAGITSWGVHQKHRADDMAAAVMQKEQALQRAVAEAKQQQAFQLASLSLDKHPLKTAKPGTATTKPAELVIPVEHPLLPPQAETEQVKNH